MLTFLSFGSGSCGNCYYLANADQAIIIDAGVGIRAIKKALLKYAVNVQNIKAILITHDHFDHTKAVGFLSRFLNRDFYASPRVIERLYNSRMISFDSEKAKPIEPGETFCLGNFKITPFRLPHDSTDNYGYSIETDGQVFTIMTDVGEVTDNVVEFIRRSNNIVIETDYDEQMLDANPRYEKKLKERIVGGNGHLSNAVTAQVLAENYHPGLKNIWLCHLSGENNTPAMAWETVADKMRQAGFTPGKDFMLDVLRRDVICGPWSFSPGCVADKTFF